MGCSPGAPTLEGPTSSKNIFYIDTGTNIRNEEPPNSISPGASYGLNLALPVGPIYLYITIVLLLQCLLYFHIP